MPSEPHKLGEYGAFHKGYCAHLELKAASDDGNIDTEKGIYFAKFSFWDTDDFGYVDIGYNAQGFKGIFSRIKPMAKSLAATMKHGRDEIARNVAVSCLERCIADLEQQTELLGTINELPPTPMCSDEPRARPARERL